MIPVFAGYFNKLRKIIEILHLSRVTIRLDAKHGPDFFDRFTRPHRRYLIIGQKTMAVALLHLPASSTLYLAGKHRQALRTNRNRCLAHGYDLRRFDPLDHRPELDAIHLSMAQRQGKKMDYCRPSDIRQAHDFRTDYLGVFSSGGNLVAFACTPTCGQAALQLSFIGHPDHLVNGVMYALQAAVVERAIKQGALWLTYEGFFGQSEGMRYFLARCGYAPANVTWRIKQDR